MITNEQFDLLDVLAENEYKDIDDVLRSFYFILEDHKDKLQAAVEVINESESGIIVGRGTGGRKRAVIHEYVHDESSRNFWKVLGSKDNEYLCFKSYCTCPSFQQTVKSVIPDSSNRLICKHLIALRLARALKLVERHKVPLDTFMQVMCGLKLIH